METRDVVGKLFFDVIEKNQDRLLFQFLLETQLD